MNNSEDTPNVGSRRDPAGSSVRWQTIAITQLGYTSNVILGLSTAAMGFQTTLLLQRPANSGLLQHTLNFFLSIHALIFLLLSVGFAIWLAVNRLRDFRVTARVARKQKKLRLESGEREKLRLVAEIESLRELYRKLGDRTWCLFWWQIGTFGAGIFLAASSIFVSILAG